LVLDLVKTPPEDDPYTALKARLLLSHQLTKFQKIEQLHQMGNLGDPKPSELLAQMLELCPGGQVANEFFLFLFLQHLPKKLRIMLGDDLGHNARALAAKADKLWAYHSHQQPGSDVRQMSSVYLSDLRSPLPKAGHPSCRHDSLLPSK
jgi:hypothetical protein